MKKINLIERLWTDSHEKQRVRGMRRYAAMIFAVLVMSIGQMWGATTPPADTVTVHSPGKVADGNLVTKWGKKYEVYFSNNAAQTSLLVGSNTSATTQAAGTNKWCNIGSGCGNNNNNISTAFTLDEFVSNVKASNNKAIRVQGINQSEKCVVMVVSGYDSIAVLDKGEVKVFAEIWNGSSYGDAAKITASYSRNQSSHNKRAHLLDKTKQYRLTLAYDATGSTNKDLVAFSLCYTPASCAAAPDAPTVFAKTSVTATTATFSITDAANAASYDIYCSTSSTTPDGETTPTATGITTKTPTITSLTSGTTYYAWVRAVCDGSHKSSWVALTNSTFTTLAAPTASFSNSTYAIGGSALDLSSLWSSNSAGSVTYSVEDAAGTGASVSTAAFSATRAGKAKVKAVQAANGSYDAITKYAYITVGSNVEGKHTVTFDLEVNVNKSRIPVTDSVRSTSLYLTTAEGDTLKGTGLSYDGGAKSGLTGKIQALASYDGDKYVYVQFSIADGYTFTLDSAWCVVQAVGNGSNQNGKLVISDTDSHSFTGSVISCPGTSSGTQTHVVVKGDGSTAFTGTVTLKIYVYGTAATYRLGEMINIHGSLAVDGYSITYNCNDATSGCPSNASGQTALPSPLPSAPTKTGYTFAGWYTDEDFEDEAEAGATLSADATLYAKWLANPSSLTNGTTSAFRQEVSWTAGSTEAAWEVYVSSTNSAPAVDATPTATPVSASYTFLGLDAGTTYYWWVRGKYSNTEKTAWVAGTSFTTSSAVRVFKSEEKIYFKDATLTNTMSGGTWKVNTGSIYAYFYNATENAWSSAATHIAGTENNAGAVYEIEVPGSSKEYTHVIFSRGTATGWSSGFWNDTWPMQANIGQNLFIISDSKSYSSDDGRDRWTGSWGKYGYPASIVGDFNDWNAYANVISDVSSNVGTTYIDLEAALTYGFKVLQGESFCGVASGTITNTTPDGSWWHLDGPYDVHITAGEAGEYVFKWNTSTYYLGVYYPQARLAKNTVLYFDARNSGADKWNAAAFTAQYNFKYYDSGSTQSTSQCLAEDTVITSVYHAAVPDNDYIGRVSIGRYSADGKSYWDATTNDCMAYNRTSSAQNCMYITSEQASWATTQDLAWTTYCPPMSSVTLTHNAGATTTYGGNGAKATPYIVEVGTSINVSASSSSSVADGNMTAKYNFKDATTSKQNEESTTFTLTASSTDNTTHKVNVDAYNYYNSTSSTVLGSDTIYYLAKTIYAITYKCGSKSTGDDIVDHKIHGTNITLRGNTTFSRPGYNLVGWATTDDGDEAHDVGVTYSTNEALTLYPVWEAKTTTVTLDANTANYGSGDNQSVTATYDAALPSFTHTTAATGYHLVGYYTGETSGDKIINADGTFNANSGIWNRTDGATLTLYAHYEINTYTVNFASNNDSYGTVSPTSIASVNHGSTVSIDGNVLTLKATDVTATAETAGADYTYAFSGWSVDNGDAITDNTTITATFTATANSYSVTHTLTNVTTSSAETATFGTDYTATFSASSGYALPSSITVTIGGDEATEDTEYTWNKSTGTVTIGGSYILDEIVIEIEAEAAVTTYSVTYAAGVTLTSGSVPTDATAYDGDGTESVTVAGNTGSMVYTGYTFRGWTYNSTFYEAGNTFTMPASNVTLTAVWDEVTETTYYYGAITITKGALTKNNTSTTQFFTNTGGTIANSTAISITTNTPSTASKYYNSNDLSDAELAKSSNWGGSSGNQYVRGLKFSNSKTYTIVLGSNVASAITFYGHGGGSKTLTVGGQEWTSNSTANTHESHTFTKSGDFTGNVSMVCGGDFYGVLVITCISGSNYTVSFENGETEPSGDIDDMPDPITGVPSGVKVLKPATDPSSTGYTFGGWYTNAKCTTEVDWSSNITADKVVYAKWTVKTTTLTFDANTSNHGDGDNGGATATYDATTLSSITHTTPEEGYRRTGYWTAATSGDKILNADGTLVKNTTYTTNDDTPKWKSELGSLTLYAQYELDVYTITYNANGGSCATSSETQESVGEKLTLPTPTWSGYTFDGWYNAGSKIGDAGDKYEPTADITLYAKWTDNIDGKVFSFIDHNYGDKFKAFDESGWVTSNQNNKDKTYTNATTGVQFVIDDGTWETKTNAIAALAKNVKGTTSMSIVIPAGYIATVKILYGAYGKGDDYRLTVNDIAQSNPDNKLDDGNTNAQVISNMKEITLENQTGTLTLSVSGSKNNYIGRVAATITGYETLHFTGEQGYNWFDTRNWSPACIPTINHDVIIENRAALYGPFTSGSHYDEGDYTTRHGKAKSIKIDKTASSNAKINIWSCASLIVAEGIKVKKVVDEVTLDDQPTTPEDLYIETNVLGNGGLICGAASANNQAEYEFYSKSFKYGTFLVNQYVGIPFTSLDGDQLYSMNIFVYDDENDAWKTPESKTLEPFTAYNYINKHSLTWNVYNLKGTLALPGIEGDGRKVELTCGSRYNAEGHFDGGEDGKEPNGDYMFANSWTAPIDIASMDEDDVDDMVQTIYIFNAGYVDPEESQKELGDLAGQWSSFPFASAAEMENAVIPATQAFCVTAKAANATLTLDYKKHVYDPATAVTVDSISNFPTRAPRRAKAETALNKLRIIVRRDSAIADQLYIFERAGFSYDFDNGWDGRKIFGKATAPQLYTKRGHANLAVDAVPDMEGTVVGFRKGKNDNVYTLSFEYRGSDDWYLNDLKEQTSTLINDENTYMFLAETNDMEARFVISQTPIQKVPTGIEDVHGQSTTVRKLMIDGKLYIIRGGRMYDATGRMVK